MNQFKRDSKILVLPSDSSVDYYPNNKLPKYTVKLDQVYEFFGDYEVALHEIIYPSSIRNITKLCRININGHVTGDIAIYGSIDIEPGIYTEETLLNRINNKIKEFHDKELEKCVKAANPGFGVTRIKIIVYPKIEKNKETDKYELKIGSFDIFVAAGGVYHMGLFNELDKYLYQLFGFTGNRSKFEDKIAEYKFDIFGQSHLMYIYSDIVDNINVGSKLLPLLQLITIDAPNLSALNSSSQKRITFKRPLFIPLSRKTIDTITIECRDDVGDLIEFENGKVVVTLFIRKNH